MCFGYQRIKIQWKNRSIFSHLLTVRAKGADPLPPYGQPHRDISFFLQLHLIAACVNSNFSPGKVLRLKTSKDVLEYS